MPPAGSSLEPAAACSCLDWARSPHLHTAAGSRPDPAVSLALGFPAQVLPGPWVPWTHSYYRLRHVTITPTQLKTKLLGSETCKWYVFVVSVAGYSRLCQSWVRHAASGQASPGNGKTKKVWLVVSYTIAKCAGTLLFRKCCKAIHNSFVNAVIISMILVHMLIYIYIYMNFNI